MPELNPLASLSEIASSLPRQPASNDSPASSGAIGLASGAPKPRRLSSAGQTRRRHSDATAATLANAVVSRISANAIPTTSPAPNHSRSRSTSSQVDESLFSLSLPPASVIEHLKVPPQSIEILKKKGHRTFKCESCGKVYTHASCLVKHRWEHNPHWHETSKLLMSKHQQVQLLEAAAILAHVSRPDPNAKPASDSTSPNPATSKPIPSPPAAGSSSIASGITTRRRASSQSQQQTPASPALVAAAKANAGAAAAGEGDAEFDEIARLSMGTSLPDDRSLWPYYVSGGAVVMARSAGGADAGTSGDVFDEDEEEEAVKFEDDEDADEADIDVISVSAGKPESDDMELEMEMEGDVEGDSGYASSGGVSMSMPATGRAARGSATAAAGAKRERAPHPPVSMTQARRTRSYSTSTASTEDPVRPARASGPGPIRTRSRSRSTASNTTRPMLSSSVSGSNAGTGGLLGATRPARLSPPDSANPATTGGISSSVPLGTGMGHRRSSSNGYHPYGSYLAVGTTGGIGSSLAVPSIAHASRSRSRSSSVSTNANPNGATVNQPIKSKSPTPGPLPVPMSIPALPSSVSGSAGVAIIGSGSAGGPSPSVLPPPVPASLPRTHTYAAYAPQPNSNNTPHSTHHRRSSSSISSSSFSSMARSSPYLNPYTTTGGSAQFGGAPSSLGTSLGTSLSLSMSMGMSSLRSSSNCVDEEDEREAEAEAEAERERHARVDHGVPMPAKRSASGMPLSMAMLEEDRHAVASSKEDDQETVDGSWDEERDERGVGMEMEMDL